MLTLLITQDTWLKQGTKQASAMGEDNKVAVKEGDRFPLERHESVEDLTAATDNDSHIKITLKTPLLGKFTWYVYQRHASILDGETLLFPAPEVDEVRSDRQLSRGIYTGKVLILPSHRNVRTDQPIISGGNFSWGEATHGGARIPKDLAAENSIISLATRLESVREEFGKAIHITSWYRPEPFNSRVGGARYSQHLTGRAVDIVIDGLDGRAIARRVLPWWIGGVGIYPGNRKHICHLDIGPKRHWGI